MIGIELMRRHSPLLLLILRVRFWTMMVGMFLLDPYRIVFLTEKLGASHEDMKHLIVPNCVSEG